MCNGIVYLKSKKRMPVQLGKPIYPRDTQQDIPVAWCAACQREIYESRETLCRRCKGVKDYE